MDGLPMKKSVPPYKCHIFVCVNDRHGARKSCADGNSKEIRLRLKREVRARKWDPKDVRVSQSLCMGLCRRGPNVLIYPQQIWFSEVTLNDVNPIVEVVENLLEHVPE